jgi:hypothetical protein
MSRHREPQQPSPIVYVFERGAASESIQWAYPLLMLEEIYGAITFYLTQTQEIDTYLAQAEATFAAQGLTPTSTRRSSQGCCIGSRRKALSLLSGSCPGRWTAT